MIRRAEREPDREILTLAKQIFHKLYPDCRINDMRPKVASLKSNVRKMKNANPDLTLDQISESIHKKFKSKLAK